MEQGESHDDLDLEDWRETDAILSALSARSRRVLLLELSVESGPTSAIELAHRLAVSDTGPTDCQDAYLELYHTHGPVLERAGLLEWDPTTGEVTMTATGQTVAARLDDRSVQ